DESGIRVDDRAGVVLHEIRLEQHASAGYVGADRAEPVEHDAGEVACVRRPRYHRDARLPRRPEGVFVPELLLVSRADDRTTHDGCTHHRGCGDGCAPDEVTSRDLRIVVVPRMHRIYLSCHGPPSRSANAAQDAATVSGAPSRVIVATASRAAPAWGLPNTSSAQAADAVLSIPSISERQLRSSSATPRSTRAGSTSPSARSAMAVV